MGRARASGPTRRNARSPSRRSAFGRRIGAEANSHQPAIQAVYDGQTCIGFLVLRGRQGVEAFDAAEHSLGVFATAKAAADAISVRAVL
jgi:hypothetical protein